MIENEEKISKMMIDAASLTKRIFNNRTEHLNRHKIQIPSPMIYHLMAECASIAYAVADEINGTKTELPLEYVVEDISEPA